MRTSSSADRALGPQWFVPLNDDGSRPHRVLALPQAGAGCSAFADCAALLPGDIGLWALNPPGRQARFDEPSITDLDDLVAGIAAELSRWTARPYVLFGYCSGALAAFLLARAVEAGAMPAPVALVVASYPAPQLVRPDSALHTLPSDEFWSRIRSFGGFPMTLAAEPDYREIFEPALRADFAAVSGFAYVDGPPLGMPIVAVAGRDDGTSSAGELRAWEAQTSAGFRMEFVDGDHWLLDGGQAAVMALVEREFRR
ncbi:MULTISPECIES: thioesterase II family protein [Actinomadura]|uniref:Thioesterase domain-containing protein n=1 Tax=Actinomadura madurae TaxID=1993 RepID=A0A1I5IDZ0_9ACTN|nr:thioesterase domain-containing protein [Actinomadura madurae]SFO58406.1 Thioesterase domain-containing protein [Actinomadura madurae]SPT57321.1 Linear gramicidin dehydrogenase LgrE [Actinomadura madurae]